MYREGPIGNLSIWIQKPTIQREIGEEPQKIAISKIEDYGRRYPHVATNRRGVQTKPLGGLILSPWGYISAGTTYSVNSSIWLSATSVIAIWLTPAAASLRMRV
jgi:hypothetical protein